MKRTNNEGFCSYFSPKVKVKLTRRARGHFMAHISSYVQSWPYMANNIFFKNRVEFASKVECTNKQAVPV